MNDYLIGQLCGSNVTRPICYHCYSLGLRQWCSNFGSNLKLVFIINIFWINLIWYWFLPNPSGLIFVLMSGSCHFDRASNDELSVEFWFFVIAMFFNCGWVLKFGAPSRYYKGALTQKTTVSIIKLLCMKNAGAHIAMDFS